MRLPARGASAAVKLRAAPCGCIFSFTELWGGNFSVQRHFWNGDSASHRVLRIESSNSQVMTQRHTSLCYDDLLSNIFETQWAYGELKKEHETPDKM
jgi:hypothetical protein